MALCCGHLQLQLHLFGDAFHPAHQPAGVQPNLHLPRRVGHKIRPHLQRHGQQHRALVAVIEQIAHADLLRHGPLHSAGAQARRQRPGQLGGQAGIAGVFPVRVPVGLVLQQHPQRGRCARGDALWRLQHQLRLHMGRARALGRRSRCGTAPLQLQALAGHLCLDLGGGDTDPQRAQQQHAPQPPQGKRRPGRPRRPRRAQNRNRGRKHGDLGESGGQGGSPLPTGQAQHPSI